jgi:hypothetical protein
MAVVVHSSLYVEVLDSVEAEWWNSLIASDPSGTIFQTAQWANLSAEYLGYRPYFLFARTVDENPAGALLLFKTATSHLAFFERPLGRFIISVLKQFAPGFLWMYGPVVVPGADRMQVTNVLVDKALAIAKAAHAQEISGTLPIHRPIPPDCCLNSAGWNLKRQATLLVDVTPDKEQLWRKLKNSARKAISAANRDRIVVERLQTLDELREYYDFVVECRRAMGLHTFSFDNLAVEWKHLRPLKAMEIFVAKWQGQLIAGLGIWAFNGILHEFASVQSRESYEKKLYGNDVIKWEIIKWGHAQGARLYDLQGIAIHPANPKEAGIRQFKEKWGGQYVEYDTYSCSRSSRWRRRVVELCAAGVSRLVHLTER